MVHTYSSLLGRRFYCCVPSFRQRCWRQLVVIPFVTNQPRCSGGGGPSFVVSAWPGWPVEYGSYTAVLLRALGISEIRHLESILDQKLGGSFREDFRAISNQFMELQSVLHVTGQRVRHASWNLEQITSLHHCRFPSI
eukprot:FR736919.1.p1 GENE.FR736919.1~~FR736919.1.p1  ORF type:complete len:138 (-),score=1.11 FR736919.1:56-469(-)